MHRNMPKMSQKEVGGGVDSPAQSNQSSVLRILRRYVNVTSMLRVAGVVPAAPLAVNVIVTVSPAAPAGL